MKLWFAWKIVLLQYRKQPMVFKSLSSMSCDLLGKSYFCSIANNRFLFWRTNKIVVICLENRTFAVSQTTSFKYSEILYLLWFAWKIVLLQYRKQLTVSWILRSFVVICLENRTFAVSQTTGDIVEYPKFWLWFAWKIVLLQYRKQQSWL